VVAVELGADPAHLKDFGYVEQESFQGKYRLGLRLFGLGSVLANSWDVRRVAGPHIEKLVDELEETVPSGSTERGPRSVHRQEGNQAID
jgi:DNA-binding IclR family transcriptional regulator